MLIFNTLYGVGLRIRLKSSLNESNCSTALFLTSSIVSKFSTHNLPSSQYGTSSGSTLLGDKYALFVSF